MITHVAAQGDLITYLRILCIPEYKPMDMGYIGEDSIGGVFPMCEYQEWLRYVGVFSKAPHSMDYLL